ncbi:MAG: dipeptidase [Gemmatimonadota bacterium]|nr:dipeptidase [Gemmatimonadota bacterium]MDH5759230.1 dipeptidase [Gemmatimonadota bacterium]
MFRSKIPGILAALTLVTAACGSGDVSDDMEAAARSIHERVITIDTHDDIPFDFATAEVDPLDADRQVTIEKMEAGGLDVGFFVVYVGQGERTPAGYEKAEADALTKFDAIHRMTDEMYPDRIGLAYTADDVERIHGEGRRVAAIGIENGFVIGKDLTLLARYHELGARYVTLAHGGHNDIADSATPREALGDGPAEHGGLSPFGEEVVAEMNRLGIMVDVSHISKDAALHAMRVSRAPVIASHSGARAVADHPRNMDDETLLALKENGGVVQAVALGGYVKVRPEFDSARTALWDSMGIRGFRDMQGLDDGRRAELDAAMEELNTRWPPASVSDFVDHIDHAVGLIGIDHVGISSDFDGGGGIVGWDDASETFNVTLELVRRGYSEEEVRRLWGGNVLRVWREVERVARETAPGS